VKPRTNDLESARAARAAAGDLVNAVNTNFADAGYRMPETVYTAAWRAWRYEPRYSGSGRGGTTARAALAQALSTEDAGASADDLILTAGSSISYHLLLSTAADHSRRRSVALPQPGYPLFKGILSPLGLAPRWYRCPPEHGFRPDPNAIRALFSDPAEGPPAALVLISPSNPAGVTIPASLFSDLASACAEYEVLLIVDEVFSLFRAEPAPHFTVHGRADISGATGPMRAHLNGLSKACAAPEIKAGWIHLFGGSARERAAWTDRLDAAHDTYLSLSGFAEAALPVFLDHPEALKARSGIRAGVEAKRAQIRDAFSGDSSWTVRVPDSGIHVPIQLDPVVAAQRFDSLFDEQVATQLVKRYGVYLHPGGWYGLRDTGGGPWFVLSLLHDDRTASAAVNRLRRAVE
jgi:aspartate/methionine/tyrosine aminotransferase